MTPEQALHKIWSKASDALNTDDLEVKQVKCEEIHTLAGRYLTVEWTTDEQDKATERKRLEAGE